MGNTLLLDCSSGISGDMTVAALLDLGANWAELKNILGSIDDDSFDVSTKRVLKSGIDCMDFSVNLDEIHENYDHDMSYLHGDNENHHNHNHHNNNHSDDESEHNMHKHTKQRNIKDIFDIIDALNINDRTKQLAKKIFNIIGEAEAKAHNIDKDMVHFHEVGAIDSIVDVVAVAFCIDNLDIDKVYLGNLVEGYGTVRCQHGILPVPVPATANILEKYKIPFEICDIKGEFITPTGAAIIAALDCKQKCGKFVIKKSGLGAGKREYEKASILRAFIIEEDKCSYETDIVYRLETNIDDCSGEVLGFTLNNLMENGALDVTYTPIFMKKNRPGYQLNVICTHDNIAEIEKIIFENTTTIGIRVNEVSRHILQRESIVVDTIYGEVNIKKCKFGNTIKYYPEYESIIEICNSRNLSYKEVYNNLINYSLQNL